MSTVFRSKGRQDALDRVDRAWLVLFGAALCMFCATPAVLQFTFGTFAPEIVRATNWSPVVINAAMGIAMLPKYFLAPVVGYAIDRFGVRRIVLFGAPVYAAGIVALGLFPASEAEFVLFLAVACTLGFAATPVLYAKLIAGWFIRRRGLAMGIVMGATSLGVSFWAPFTSIMMPYGWRSAYVVLGLASGAIILASAVLLLREAPSAMGERSAPADPARIVAAAGFELGEALRSFNFWRITLVFALLNLVFSGTAMNLPIILRMDGLSAQDAASVTSVVGITMLIGVLVAGLMFDRWFTPFVTGAFALLGAGAFALILFNPSVPAFFVAAALIGAGLGVQLNAAALIVSFAFGAKSFGSLYGFVTLAFGVASAIGSSLFGAALAASVSLDLLFGAGLAALLPAIFLLFTMRGRDLPYEPAKRQHAVAPAQAESGKA